MVRGEHVGISRIWLCLPGLVGSALLLLGGCEAPASPPLEEIQGQVVVDTEGALGWRQHQVNLAFARGYQPRCALAGGTGGGRPRVLLTGFGRFLQNRENATGRLVSKLVPAAVYPLTSPPAPGAVDDPASQTSVARSTLALPGIGEVDVCAMILPVSWDLSALLVLAEARAFGPDVLFMNGIAGPRQPLWMELGSVNRAVALQDGSGVLSPLEPGAWLVSGLPDAEQAQGLLLSWDEVRAAAQAAIARRASEADGQGRTFGSILQGVRFAGFPRESNTYLCNNTTFVVNHALAHSGQTLRLLEASHPWRVLGGELGGDQATGIDFALGVDLRLVPREFLHWPSQLEGAHLDRAAEVLRALIAAQLLARTPPSVGDPAQAEAL